MTGMFSPIFQVFQPLHGFAGKSLALLLDAAIKGASLLLLCGVLAVALRRASAAARHLVWSLGLGAMLALPFFSLLLPAWNVSVSAESPSGTVGEQSVTTRDSPAVIGSSQIEVGRTTRAPSVHSGTGEDPSRIDWILCLWSIGAALLMARIAVGEHRVRRIAGRSLPFETQQAKAVLDNVRSSFRFSRTVQLRISAEIAVPFTRGALRPAVLLPAEAPQWSRKQLEWVLAHELAHVRRNDYLTQMAAQLVCALFWFHPLIWLAASAMRRERERACDDIVLSLGHPATDYAEFILLLSRSLQGTNGAWLPDVAMAQSSQLEVRMKALLDRQLNHKPLAAKRALLVATLAVLLVLPVAALRMAAKDASGNISGTVVDPSGAVIPGARITLVNIGRKLRIDSRTGADGTFEFTAIPPGRYRLEISSPGFAETTSLDLNLGPSGELHEGITMDIREGLDMVVVHGRKPAENPPAPTTAPRRIRVGGNVQAAKLTFQVKPDYPQALQKQGIEGTVILHAVIGTSGQILSLKPFNDADPTLTKAAMDAVRQWRYSPTLLNGEPVEVVTTITVDFQLDQ